MDGWVPGFSILEGPERTGLSGRYVGLRESDRAHAWIRVDGYPPNEMRMAVLAARIYQATAALQHPDLPRVLAFGSTAIPGRPFIAFQAHVDAPSPGGPPALEDAAEVLAELQLFAYEAGLSGLHFPAHELDRIRAGRAVAKSRLPLREFLADPRRPDGASSLAELVPENEWGPFTAPELRAGRRSRSVSVRQALTYRVAAQVHYLQTGAPFVASASHRNLAPHRSGRERLSVGDTSISGSEGNAGLSFRRERGLALEASLHANPNRRPALETFMA